MEQEIEDFVRGCHECQQRKILRGKPKQVTTDGFLPEAQSTTTSKSIPAQEATIDDKGVVNPQVIEKNPYPILIRIPTVI